MSYPEPFVRVEGHAWSAVEDALLIQGFVPDLERMPLLGFDHDIAGAHCSIRAGSVEMDWVGPADGGGFERRRYLVCPCGAWLWLERLPEAAR